MKIILADNQEITRVGLEYVITHTLEDSEYSALLNAPSHTDMIQALRKDDERAVVFLDYTLYNIYGVNELLNLSSRFPHAKWVMFSDSLTESIIRRLSIEQEFSILLKDSSIHEIQTALRYVMKGERYLSNQITNLLLTPTKANEVEEKLTTSEKEILKLIAEGKSVKEIANERCSSTHTITTHKKNIFRKLNVNTVYEATKYAFRAGLVEMADYYI